MSKFFPSLKGRPWTVYFFMAIYAVAGVFTVVESALPGDISSIHSSFVGNILAERAHVGGQVRKCHRGGYRVEVEDDFALVFRVVVGQYNVARRKLHPVCVQIFRRRFVDGEESVFRAAFDCHIRNRKPVFHGKCGNVAEEFEGFIGRAVHAEHSYQSEHDVLARHLNHSLSVSIAAAISVEPMPVEKQPSAPYVQV